MNKYNPKIHKRRSIRLKGYDYSQAGLYFVTMCVQNRDRLFGSIHNGKLKNNDAGKMIEKWYFELENKFPNVHCGEHIIMPDHFHCIIHIVRPVGLRAGLCTFQCVRAGLCTCPNRPTQVQANQCVRAGLCTCPNESVHANCVRAGQCVRAGLCACPNTPTQAQANQCVRAGLCVRADLCVCPNNSNEHNQIPISNEHNQIPISGEHNQIPISGEHTGSPLSAMVQWFKTMTTNEYIRNVKSNNWQRFNGKLWQRNYWEHIIRNEKSHKNISRYIINNPSKWNMTH